MCMEVNTQKTLGWTSDSLNYSGLSPSIHSVDQIKVVDRFRGESEWNLLPQRSASSCRGTEIPHEGPMADLVWSDPDAEKEDFAISPRSVFVHTHFYRLAATAAALGSFLIRFSRVRPSRNQS